MARPRRSLKDYNPALQNQAAVTLADMAAQTIDTTMVANTGLNTVLNSIRTTDVYFYLYPAGGQSFQVAPVEVTAPTQSAVFIHLRGNTGAAEIGFALRMKGFLIQGS